jgi:peptide deformylase
MILKVARLGHPVLRRRAQRVPRAIFGSPGLKAFVSDLWETMREYDGVGIAAPQVHVSSQVAVIEVDRNPRYPKAPRIPLTVLINPRWRPIGHKKEEDWEGCLSIDGLRGRVPRWRTIEVEAWTVEGEPIRFRAQGFFARVIQHEWDHLQGKVFLDRMKNFAALTHLTEYHRYWVDRSDG